MTSQAGEFILEGVKGASSFCHIVIPAPDLPKAKDFYEEVFGWRVRANHPGAAYWFFESGNVSGGFDSNAQPTQGSIVLVLEVEDMPAVIPHILQLGGTILQGRSRIGEAAEGYDAYFLDPTAISWVFTPANRQRNSACELPCETTIERAACRQPPTFYTDEIPRRSVPPKADPQCEPESQYRLERGQSPRRKARA